MRSGIAVLLALGAAGPAAAQNVCDQFHQAPPVGSWVKYGFEGQGQSGNSRMAAVGAQGNLTWYEMSADFGGQDMLVKILAEGGFYHAMAEKKIEEVVVKMAGQPAMKFSGAMMDRVRTQMQVGNDPASQFGQGCEDAERVGVETITVPAGTFKAVHYRVSQGANSGDAWIVEDMPFGLIQWTGSKGEKVVMLGNGDDAVPTDLGPVMDMPGIPGPPPPQ